MPLFVGSYLAVWALVGVVIIAGAMQRISGRFDETERQIRRSHDEAGKAEPR